MYSRFVSIAALLLAAFVGLQFALNASQTGIRTDFTQASYRPLLLAESELANRRYKDALRHFRVTMLRANRCGQIDVSDRVRVRMGAVGEGLLREEPAVAWQFLAKYVLWSRQVTKTASSLELALLSEPTPTTHYEYPLMDESGWQTVWKDTPALAPLWLYRRLPSEGFLDNLPGRLYNTRPGELPATGDWCHSIPIRMDLRGYSGMASLRVSVPSRSGQTWYVSGDNRVRWGCPFHAESRNETDRTISIDQMNSLDRIVAVGGRRLPMASITLVHDYKKF